MFLMMHGTIMPRAGGLCETRQTNTKPGVPCVYALLTFPIWTSQQLKLSHMVGKMHLSFVGWVIKLLKFIKTLLSTWIKGYNRGIGLTVFFIKLLGRTCSVGPICV